MKSKSEVESRPLKEIFRKLLGVRGVHWIATRLGSRKLRSLSFDEKFKNGEWRFPEESPDLVALVEDLSAGGHILTLGCGTGQIANALAKSSYESFLGLDLSREAIALAKQSQTDTIQFEVGDMEKHNYSARLYNVILFPDSINYVCWSSRKRLLRKLTTYLTPRGRIIVVITHPDRYASILKMIRKHFRVDIDRRLVGTNRHLIMFR